MGISRFPRSCLIALALCILLPASSLAASGEVRVLLMVVDGNQPIPRNIRHYEHTQVTNTVWTDVSTIHHFAFERDTSFARLFDEMSFGQLKITGDTLSMALPYDASDHSWTEWVALADAEAQNRGFDLSAYDRYLYILPFLPKGAPATGLARNMTAWCSFFSYIELSCIFHELGHTLGFSHAGELLPDGTSNVYGDKSDGLMGSGYNSHANTVNKSLAGWLSEIRLQRLDATGSSTFTLAAQSVTPDTLQAVKIINKGARPAVGVVDTFVSFRDTGGFDAQLINSSPDINGDEVANAVLIHQMYRLHGGDTIYLQALKEGEIYDEHGVIVTVDSISGDHATVTVARAPYNPTPPQVVITPQDFDAQPWQNRYYTVSITNTNDPSKITFESLFDVSFTSIGSGWLTSWTSSLPKTVAPGETRDFQLRVMAPGNAAIGSYDFTITATDRDGEAGPVSASASASYSVVGPEVDTYPPSTPSGLTGGTDGTAVFLSWNASTDTQSGVAGYQVLRDDATVLGNFQLIGTTTSNGYTDSGVTPGTSYRYTVRAFDALQNVGFNSNVFALTITGPPGAPTGLVASASPGQVELAWSPPADDAAVAGYAVLRDGTGTAKTTGTAFTDTRVASGTTYTYTVQAFDAQGNAGLESTSVSVETPSSAVSPPVNLAVAKLDLKRGKLKITWQDATDASITVTRFRVYREGVLLASTNKLTYDDKTVISDNTYHYSVRAVASSGEVSAASDSLAVFFGAAGGTPLENLGPDTTPPSAPSGLTVSYDQKKGKNKLEWKASTDNVGVAGYKIIRDGSVLAEIPKKKSQYDDAGIQRGSTHSYTVLAVDAAGNESSESNVASGG